jgi:hypothetical protein
LRNRHPATRQKTLARLAIPEAFCSRLGCLLLAVAGEVVVTTSDAVPVPPAVRATDVGFTVQVEFAGAPLQVKLIVSLKVALAARLSGITLDWPSDRVSVPALVSVKAGASVVTVTAEALDVTGLLFESPV